MSGTKRSLLIGVGALMVVIVVAVYFLIAGLDELVRAAVEKTGSRVTQVEVSLDKAEVKPTEGRAALHGLEVSNPTGFQSDNSFRIGSIIVTIDAATVTQNPIVIKEVVVTSAEVTYELGANGSNIDAIRRNVESYGGGKKKAEAQGPKLIIENFYVRGGKVNVSAVPLGGKSMAAPLPEIHLKNIGKDKGGASHGEVAATVLATLTSRVGSFVASLDLGGVFEGVEKVPETLKSLTRGTVEKAGKATKDAGEAVKGVGEEAKKGIKKFIGD